MPVLLVERGNDKGLSLKIEPAKSYVVGRENDKAAFQLNDPMASRAHFQISAANGMFRIRDMKSRNGTKLNDEKLPAEGDLEIKIGDKVQVGETIFSFLSDAKEESAAGGLIGKTIGGYRLLERVGRGGMGTVYKAEQISLNRVVALKVLSAKLLSDPLFVERFVQEAKAAGGLTHPNIVQVIDVGSDRGIYFFSMEFLDKGSVGDVATKEGKIPWERALEMMTDAARGLIFAEKRGIVHRDIKPDNLMLTSEGAVKIGDLGLAKKAEDLGGEGGQIFGTPHFIAPEQAQGKPVDNRADIYALGATFYRVLTGKTPFSGENVKEILLKQIQQEPESISKLVPDMPDELGAVVGKMMRKKPDDRYRSAQGLFEDLERIRVRYHLEAHGAAVSARRMKWIGGVLALAVCGLGYGVWHYAMKPPRRVEVIKTIRDPNQKDPVNTGPAVTPDMQAVYDYVPLSDEMQSLIKSLGGDVDKTWRGHEKEWLDLAGKMEKFAKDHPGTPTAGKADKQAKEIRKTIEDSKAAWELKSAKINADLQQVFKEMRELAEKGKFNEAVAKMAEAEKLLVKANQEFLQGTPAKDLQALLREIVDAAESAMKPLVKAAEDHAPIFPGKEYLDDRDALSAIWKGMVPAGPAKDPSTAALASFAKKIDDTLASTRKTAEDTADEAIDADGKAWFETYLGIRRLLHEDAPPDFPETPFFMYRWDDCIGRWEALRKVLRTKPFVEKVDLKIAVYKRCKHLFETVVGLVRAGKISDPDFPESVRKRTTLDLDKSKKDKATIEGVWAVRGTGTKAEFTRFDVFTPREFYTLFLKEGDSLPFSGEDHLDLACFLAEAGVGDKSNTERNIAIMGSTPVLVDKALERWLQQENNAYFELNGPGGPVALYNRYLNAKTGGARKDALEEFRTEITKRIKETQAKETYWTTDFSILNASEGGPEGPRPDRILPSDAVREILETLGVEGGKRLPPASNVPPPPPNGNGGNQPPPPPSGGANQGKEEAPPPPPPPPSTTDPDKPK